MNWPVWRDVEQILVAADIKPVLAVVPSNQDAKLNVCAPEERFWDIVRSWQERGWTIGIHGYQHRYVTKDAGLVGLNTRSEFAGVPAHEQAEKLKAGLEIFRQESVRPEVWIAPGHSFDDATVGALKDLGVKAISDGFYLSPHRDAREMLWIPQQMWSLRYRPFGLWTVCYHVNSWKPQDVRRFEDDVAAYRSRITSIKHVLATPMIRRKSWYDEWFSRALLATIRSKRWVKSYLE
jgi:peptidoglycan/xylan/chitin deacetylase (PgdA/CDA1 family)